MYLLSLITASTICTRLQWLLGFLKDEYTHSRHDTYAAFILCLLRAYNVKFLVGDGFLGNVAHMEIVVWEVLKSLADVGFAWFIVIK